MLPRHSSLIPRSGWRLSGLRAGPFAAGTRTGTNGCSHNSGEWKYCLNRTNAQPRGVRSAVVQRSLPRLHLGSAKSPACTFSSAKAAAQSPAFPSLTTRPRSRRPWVIQFIRGIVGCPLRPKSYLPSSDVKCQTATSSALAQSGEHLACRSVLLHKQTSEIEFRGMAG